MRVACVISSLGGGGAERVMSHLAGAWSATHDVTVFTYDDGTLPAFHQLPDAVVHAPLALDSHSAGTHHAIWQNMRRLARLRAALAASAPDVVVSFGDRVNVLTLLALVGRRVPVIVSERVDPRHYDPGRAWRWLRWITYRRAHAVVVQTERTREYLSQWLPGTFTTIPNPVDIPETTPDPGERVVVGIGRLVPQKGFDVLLRGFEQAGIAAEGWRLEIAGAGPERAALEALASQLGVAAAVSFHGLVADPAPLLRRAGIFALTSRFEGFPNALAEAMAHGRAVVATDCRTGPRELTAGGQAGRLVPVDNVGAVAAALAELAASAPLRVQLGAAAQAAVALYSPSTVLGQWNALLTAAAPVGRGRGR